MDQKRGLTFVNGPRGFGKSFALYHLYCSLRLDDKYRVIYIADCADLMSQPFSVLAEAFTSGFAEDLAFLNETLPLLSERDPDWFDFLREVAIHCSNTSKTFVAIFDQYNGLKRAARQSDPNNFPLWTLSLPSAKIVIAATADNEEEPFKLDDRKAFYWFGEGFTEVELKAWQRLTNFFTMEDLTEVTTATGNIPLELDSMNDTTKDTLEETLQDWEAVRRTEMEVDHFE